MFPSSFSHFAAQPARRPRGRTGAAASPSKGSSPSVPRGALASRPPRAPHVQPPRDAGVVGLGVAGGRGRKGYVTCHVGTPLTLAKVPCLPPWLRSMQRQHAEGRATGGGERGSKSRGTSLGTRVTRGSQQSTSCMDVN